MTADSNYKKYRQLLMLSPPPCIPNLYILLFIELFSATTLGDLTHGEDGNPDEVDNLINFKKRMILVETIRLVQQFQKTPYQYAQVEPFHTFLEQLPTLDMDGLYALSQFLEPKK